MNAPPHSGASRPLRLFVALWPSPALQQAFADTRRRWRWPPRAALTAPEKLHATLHFIGDFPAARLAGLQAALRQVPCEPCELLLDTEEVWSNGVAVLRSRETPPALAALYAALVEAMRPFGYRPERRPFVPHVTLARRAGGAGVPTAAPIAIAWPLQGFALVESRLAPAPARYALVERFPPGVILQ